MSMRAYLPGVIGLCVLRMAIQMLLPDENLRRYADLGVGLIVTLTLLGALSDLMRGML